MSPLRTFMWGILPAIALSLCLPGQAATVYRTVDANGVISFSDTPPEGDSLVETLEIDVPQAQLTATEQERLQAMRETTDRMARDRRERERHRAELRQRQAEPQTRPGYQEPYSPGYMEFSPGSATLPHRQVVRRWYRPGPLHPIVRPPLRSVDPGNYGGRKLLRPGGNYPASLVRRHYSPPVRAAFEK